MRSEVHPCTCTDDSIVVQPLWLDLDLAYTSQYRNSIAMIQLCHCFTRTMDHNLVQCHQPIFLSCSKGMFFANATAPQSIDRQLHRAAAR